VAGLLTLTVGVGWAGEVQQKPAPRGVPSPPQDRVSSESVPTFVSKVNLVPLTVVVRDRSGHAVGHLKREDFQVFDNGQRQELTGFAVESPGPAGLSTGEPGGKPQIGPEAAGRPAVAARFVLYLFDDLHLQFSDLYRVREAAARVLANSFQPGDRVAIHTTSGRVSEVFTGSQAKIQSALRRVTSESTAAELVTRCPGIGYYLADLIVNKSDGQALNAATAQYAACSGNDQVSTQETLTIARSVLRDHEARTLQTVRTIRNAVQWLADRPGQRTLVLLSPGFLLPSDEQRQFDEIISRAIRAHVAISTLDARGLQTVPGFDASVNTPAGGLESLAGVLGYLRAEALAQSEVLANLAESSGGVWHHDNNDLQAGLQRMAATPEFVYNLAFTPSLLKSDGKYHSLKVVLKDPAGLTVHTRKGYFEQNRKPDPVARVRQEIEDAVFSREDIHDFPLQFRTPFSTSTEGAATLSVVGTVSAGLLQYRLVGERNLNTLTLVAIIFDSNGTVVSAQQKKIDLQPKAEVIQQGVDLSFPFDVSLQGRPGRYTVRLVARESERGGICAVSRIIEIR